MRRRKIIRDLRRGRMKKERMKGLDKFLILLYIDMIIVALVLCFKIKDQIPANESISEYKSSGHSNKSPFESRHPGPIQLYLSPNCSGEPQ